MGLSDYQISRKTIEGPGGSFSVRGLSGTDLIELSHGFGVELSEAFQEIISAKDRNETVTVDGIQQVITKLLPRFPRLAAQIICVAADDRTPKALETAGNLDIVTQLEAILGVFEETFKSEAQLKKLVETIIATMGKLTLTLNSMNVSISDFGFGESDDKLASAGGMATSMQ